MSAIERKKLISSRSIHVKVVLALPLNENFMHVCRILSVGYDPILMPVRSMLLRQTGYEVVEAHSAGDALKRIKAGNFDLLLICHTVKQDEQDTLIEAMRLSWPAVPVLCLTTTPEYSDWMSHCSAACSTAPEFLADVSNAVRIPPGKRAS
jgi:CheY-like chemotaxis protein